MKRIVRFGVVGILNSGIDLGLFDLLHGRFHLIIILANAISYLTALTNSFFFNKVWTFSSARTGRRVMHDYLLFFVGNFIGWMISTSVVYLLSVVVSAGIAKVISILLVFPWNYWFSERFVYVGRHEIDGTFDDDSLSGSIAHSSNVQ